MSKSSYANAGCETDEAPLPNGSLAGGGKDAYDGIEGAGAAGLPREKVGEGKGKERNQTFLHAK